MSRIGVAFGEGPILIPYITAGDPSQESTIEYVEALVKGGAKIICILTPRVVLQFIAILKEKNGIIRQTKKTKPGFFAKSFR